MPFFSGASPARGNTRTCRATREEPLAGVLAFRPEASLLYFNTEHALTVLLTGWRQADLRTVFCELSGSPTMDLARARMLAQLYEDLHARGGTLTVVGAHGGVPDLLRAEGLDSKIHGIDRGTTLEDALSGLANQA